MCISRSAGQRGQNSARGGQFMSDLERKDWRELSEAASREKDPEKLMDLIRALNKALERREREERDRNQTATDKNILQMQRAGGYIFAS